MQRLRNLLVISILACTSSVANALIKNPSFEDGLNDWTINGVGSFGYNESPVFATDGSYTARLYSFTSCANSGCGFFSFNTGDYVGLSQSFDMSTVSAILFDSFLDNAPPYPDNYSVYQPFMTAAAYIDSTMVWGSQTLGQFLDISIDTSSLTGIHELEFRIEAIGSGSDYKSDYFYIDNIRLDVTDVPEPSILSLLGIGLLGIILSRIMKA
jgi:hypothetical protein